MEATNGKKTNISRRQIATSRHFILSNNVLPKMFNNKLRHFFVDFFVFIEKLYENVVSQDEMSVIVCSFILTVTWDEQCIYEGDVNTCYTVLLLIIDLTLFFAAN